MNQSKYLAAVDAADAQAKLDDALEQACRDWSRVQGQRHCNAESIFVVSRMQHLDRRRRAGIIRERKHAVDATIEEPENYNHDEISFVEGYEEAADTWGTLYFPR